MSRTYRKGERFNYKAYRHPHTQNEMRKLRALLDDNDYTRNRDKVRSKTLPTVYDDIVRNGVYEDYKWKHHWD